MKEALCIKEICGGSNIKKKKNKVAMLYCPKSAGDTWEKMECLTNKNRIIKAPILVGGWTDEWLGVSKTWRKECSEKM